MCLTQFAASSPPPLIHLTLAAPFITSPMVYCTYLTHFAPSSPHRFTFLTLAAAPFMTSPIICPKYLMLLAPPHHPSTLTHLTLAAPPFMTSPKIWVLFSFEIMAPNGRAVPLGSMYSPDSRCLPAANSWLTGV